MVGAGPQPSPQNTSRKTTSAPEMVRSRVRIAATTVSCWFAKRGSDQLVNPDLDLCQDRLAVSLERLQGKVVSTYRSAGMVHALCKHSPGLALEDQERLTDDLVPAQL